jgi:hypothetical protein
MHRPVTHRHAMHRPVTHRHAMHRPVTHHHAIHPHAMPPRVMRRFVMRLRVTGPTNPMG